MSVAQWKKRVFLQSFKKTQIILFTKAEVNKNIDILISFTDHVCFSFTDRQSNMGKKNSNKHLHHKPLLTQTHVFEQIGFKVFAYKYKQKKKLQFQQNTPRKTAHFFLFLCCILFSVAERACAALLAFNKLLLA